MKINQVEELVGITKKNIRFYEDQGLVKPERNPDNGYREYSISDVKQLEKIKLLRMLDVPCEDIRRLINNDVSIKECMETHSISLAHRQHDIENMKEMCDLVSSEDPGFEEMRVEDYLERMNELEKGGVRFMDIQKSDQNIRRTGAIIAALAGIMLLLITIGIMIYGFIADPIPLGILILMMLIPVAMIVCIIFALYQRINEIKGGELDEAGKY